jgi:hypothetical protein
VADSTAAGRICAALVAAFAAALAGLEGARTETRLGCLLLVSPPPLALPNGAWAQRDGGAAVAELSAAMASRALRACEHRAPLGQRAQRLGL